MTEVVREGELVGSLVPVSVAEQKAPTTAASFDSSKRGGAARTDSSRPRGLLLA